MTMDLGLRRQFFAEEVAAVANLKTPQLVEALASLPREKFLRPRTMARARRSGLR
jgi:protein-L-isoaspartate O-methyltransferase